MTTLTIETLINEAQYLARATPPLIGIVCRPEIVHGMRRVICVGDTPDSLLVLCGVPFYIKPDQEEAYRLFYDHDEMRRYLNP